MSNNNANLDNNAPSLENYMKEVTYTPNYEKLFPRPPPSHQNSMTMIPQIQQQQQQQQLPQRTTPQPTHYQQPSPQPPQQTYQQFNQTQPQQQSFQQQTYLLQRHVQQTFQQPSLQPFHPQPQPSPQPFQLNQQQSQPPPPAPFQAHAYLLQQQQPRQQMIIQPQLQQQTHLIQQQQFQQQQQQMPQQQQLFQQPPQQQQFQPQQQQQQQSFQQHTRLPHLYHNLINAPRQNHCIIPTSGDPLAPRFTALQQRVRSHIRQRKERGGTFNQQTSSNNTNNITSVDNLCHQGVLVQPTRVNSNSTPANTPIANNTNINPQVSVSSTTRAINLSSKQDTGTQVTPDNFNKACQFDGRSLMVSKALNATVTMTEAATQTPEPVSEKTFVDRASSPINIPLNDLTVRRKFTAKRRKEEVEATKNRRNDFDDSDSDTDIDVTE